MYYSFWFIHINYILCLTLSSHLLHKQSTYTDVRAHCTVALLSILPYSIYNYVEFVFPWKTFVRFTFLLTFIFAVAFFCHCIFVITFF